LFLAFLLLIPTYASPIVDTTDNQLDKIETSTTFKQIFEHTSADQLVENKTASILNVSNVPFVTTNITNIPNSTASNIPVEGRGVTGKVVYYNPTTISYSDNSSPGLSNGAIAGIVVGVIILLCCCGAGGTYKSGYWANVWISD
jgi:hypothetical protein